MSITPVSFDPSKAAVVPRKIRKEAQLAALDRAALVALREAGEAAAQGFDVTLLRPELQRTLSRNAIRVDDPDEPLDLVIDLVYTPLNE